MNLVTIKWLTIVSLVFATLLFTYNAGRQSVLQKLASDKVEVLKDGQKVDAAVYAADDDGLICLLIACVDD